MIEVDIINYLKSDASLDSLLGATASDSKIYPIQAPHQVTGNYIVFSLPAVGTLEENLEETTMSFNCTADTYLAAKNIRDRLGTLLDRQDKIRNLIPSTNYFFYWCKMTAGPTFKDPDVDLYHNVGIFDFKFNQMQGISLQPAIVALPGDDKTFDVKVTGTIVNNEIVIDSKTFGSNITVTGMGLYIREAPEGDDLEVTVLRGGVTSTLVGTLPANNKNNETSFTPTFIAGTESIGFKITKIGSTYAGSDLTISLKFR